MSRHTIPHQDHFVCHQCGFIDGHAHLCPLDPQREVLDLSARVAELEGELLACREEAELYRYLRDVDWYGSALQSQLNNLPKSDWNAAIRAAIQQGKP